MEARDVELQHFADKAHGYKKALEVAPQARWLEVSVAAALIAGHCRERGWALHNVRIVDLMAGSGYLAGHLHSVGFKDVHAIEACTAMEPQGADPSARHIEWHHVESVAMAIPVLREIRPHVIVALAGFHHLIRRSGEYIDELASVVWQADVAKECASCLETGGALLILDLCEFGALKHEAGPTVVGWDGSVFDRPSPLAQPVVDALAATRSLEEYDAAVGEHVARSGEGCALGWFRQVVRPESPLGHDDVAVSDEFLMMLRWGHAVQCGRFRCPWVFGNEAQLEAYMLNKFGFVAKSGASPGLWARLREKLVGTSCISRMGDGQLAVGWDLCVVKVLAGDRDSAGAERGLLATLVLCDAALVVRAAWKWIDGIGFAGSEKWMDLALGTLVGALFGEAFAWWRARKR